MQLSSDIFKPLNATLRLGSLIYSGETKKILFISFEHNFDSHKNEKIRTMVGGCHRNKIFWLKFLAFRFFIIIKYLISPSSYIPNMYVWPFWSRKSDPLKVWINIIFAMHENNDISLHIPSLIKFIAPNLWRLIGKYIFSNPSSQKLYHQPALSVVSL